MAHNTLYDAIKGMLNDPKCDVKFSDLILNALRTYFYSDFPRIVEKYPPIAKYFVGHEWRWKHSVFMQLSPESPEYSTQLKLVCKDLRTISQHPPVKEQDWKLIADCIHTNRYLLNTVKLDCFKLLLKHIPHDQLIEDATTAFIHNKRMRMDLIGRVYGAIGIKDTLAMDFDKCNALQIQGIAAAFDHYQQELIEDFDNKVNSFLELRWKTIQEVLKRNMHKECACGASEEEVKRSHRSHCYSNPLSIITAGKGMVYNIYLCKRCGMGTTSKSGLTLHQKHWHT